MLSQTKSLFTITSYLLSYPITTTSFTLGSNLGFNPYPNVYSSSSSSPNLTGYKSDKSGIADRIHGTAKPDINIKSKSITNKSKKKNLLLNIDSDDDATITFKTKNILEKD